MQNCHHFSLFYLLIIQLKVYKRTITRFIADDRVVCQRVKRATRLASDNSWARRRLKHLSRRPRSMPHFNEECQLHTTSHEMVGAFLDCPPDWSRGPPLHWTRSAAAWLRILFSRLSMLPSFQPLQVVSKMGKFTQQPSCTIPLWQIEIF